MLIPPEVTATWSDAEWVKAILGGVAAILGSLGTFAVFRQRQSDKAGDWPAMSSVEATKTAELNVRSDIADLKGTIIGLHRDREDENRRNLDKLTRIEDRTRRS